MSGISDSIKISMKNRPSGFIGELTRRVKQEIKDDTPVDTGRLKGAWRAKGNNSGVMKFWNNTDYAEYVEDGSGNNSAGPVRMLQRNIRRSQVTRLAKKVDRSLRRKKSK